MCNEVEDQTKERVSYFAKIVVARIAMIFLLMIRFGLILAMIIKNKKMTRDKNKKMQILLKSITIDLAAILQLISPHYERSGKKKALPRRARHE